MAQESRSDVRQHLETILGSSDVALIISVGEILGALAARVPVVEPVQLWDSGGRERQLEMAVVGSH